MGAAGSFKNKRPRSIASSQENDPENPQVIDALR